MAAQVVSAAPTNATDAAFRAWGSGISAALAAAGLVKTADTGQINWTTVLAPTTTNTQVGYEIWRFSDALQSTYPVFVRIDYGSNFYFAVNPQIWVTVGTATNGAGTILASGSFPGAATTQLAVLSSGNVDWHSASVSNIYVDSDAGASLLIAGWYNAAGSGNIADTGGLLLVERTREFDGTANGEGLLCVRSNPGASAPNSATMTRLMLIRYAVQFAQGGWTNGLPALAGTGLGLSVASSAVGSTVYPMPVFTGFTPRICGPSKHIIGVFAGDFAVNTQFTMTEYGTSRTWNACGPNTRYCACDGGTPTLASMAFRIA